MTGYVPLAISEVVLYVEVPPLVLVEEESVM